MAVKQTREDTFLYDKRVYAHVEKFGDEGNFWWNGVYIYIYRDFDYICIGNVCFSQFFLPNFFFKVTQRVRSSYNAKG